MDQHYFPQAVLQFSFTILSKVWYIVLVNLHILCGEQEFMHAADVSYWLATTVQSIM